MVSILLGGVSFTYISLDLSNLSLIGNSAFQLIFVPVLIGGIFGFVVMLIVKRQLQGYGLEQRVSENQKIPVFYPHVRNQRFLSTVKV